MFSVVIEIKAIYPNTTNNCMTIPTELQIKPEFARPLPSSLFFSISFIAFLDVTTPKTPRNKPINGISIDKIPIVKEITELLFVLVFSIIKNPPYN